MSDQIPEHHVKQYNANVIHLVQQKTSKLRRCCRIIQVNGKAAFVDQIGMVGSFESPARHADTQYANTPHARRRLTTRKIYFADLVDQEDKLKMIYDPTSEYAKAGAMQLGRVIDTMILQAADGIAYAGEDGNDPVSFLSDMIVPVTTRNPGVTSANYGLNLAKLIDASQRLGSNDVDQDEEKIMVINARQLSSLLSDRFVTSADYNTLKPLYDGNIVRYMGFTIIMCNRTFTDTNSYDKVPFWTKDGMAFGVSKDVSTTIDRMPSKNNSTQIYVDMMVGSTRLEEKRVGYIECHQTNGPGA